MTLNIALTAREAVYLTGDFRISYHPPGSAPSKDDYEAEKLVPICKFGWCGMISFCGIAKLATGRPVGDWIAEQTRPDNLTCSVQDVVGRLRGADMWLSQLPVRRSLSIIFTGFEGRRPFLFLLSNSERPDGTALDRLSKQLSLEASRPKTSEIRFFGDKRAAQKIDGRSLLESLNEDPRRDLSPQIAELNEHAACATVSRECVVGRVFPTGQAEIRPFVDRRPGYIPGYIRRHFLATGVAAIEPKVDESGRQLEPSWVGAAYTIDKDHVVVMHAIANAKAPVAGPSSLRGSVFWKIAEADEKPPTLTWTRQTSEVS